MLHPTQLPPQAPPRISVWRHSPELWAWTCSRCGTDYAQSHDTAYRVGEAHYRAHSGPVSRARWTNFGLDQLGVTWK